MYTVLLLLLLLLKFNLQSKNHVLVATSLSNRALKSFIFIYILQIQLSINTKYEINL